MYLRRRALFPFSFTVAQEITFLSRLLSSFESFKQTLASLDGKSSAVEVERLAGTLSEKVYSFAATVEPREQRKMRGRRDTISTSHFLKSAPPAARVARDASNASAESAAPHCSVAKRASE
jgi:hypothetical protein